MLDMPTATARTQRVAGLISPELCATATSYLRIKAEVGEMQLGDGHVHNSYASYADLLMEVILQQSQPQVEQAIGTGLLPTYSYARLYANGDQLTPHTDRPACEVTVTVLLGADTARPWPIFIRTPDGVDEITLSPGDALIYPGPQFEHWRERFDGRWQAQLTLHYVRAEGPDAGWRFDKRPGLGRHPGTRRA